MVEEGRTWHTVSLIPRVPLSQVPLDNISKYYQNLVREGTCTASQHEYVLKGDTVIIGKTYKKLLRKDSSETFLAALRQEGDRVYAIDDEGTSEYTLFDFSLKVGDIVKSHVDELEMMRVEQVDTVLVDGKECRRLFMWHYEKDADITNGLVDVWIEGVGCMSGPFFTFAWSATNGSSLLLGCYQDDRQLVITDTSVFAQTEGSDPMWLYTSFTSWHMENEVVMGSDGYDRTFFYEGDSVEIGGIMYAKLKEGGLQTITTSRRTSSPQGEGRDYTIGIRHEGGRVYVNADEYNDYLLQRGYHQDYDLAYQLANPDYVPYAMTDNGEMVLYDYTMEVGDVFCHVDGHDDISVVSKEVIALDDQLPRRKLTLNNGLVLIEGIGCINSNGMLLAYLNPKPLLQSNYTYLVELWDYQAAALTVYRNQELNVKDMRYTAVDAPERDSHNGVQYFYDLQGRRLPQKSAKGVYIEGGKKRNVR